MRGTQRTFTYRQTTPHQSTSEVFYRTDKITPTGGFEKLAFASLDNSGDASLKVEENLKYQHPYERRSPYRHAGTGEGERQRTRAGGEP